MPRPWAPAEAGWGGAVWGCGGGRRAHLEAMEVLRLEVVGGAAAPVHDVLVLALAAQLAVPVGDAQVVVHHGVAVGAVLQHRVEEGLRGREGERPEARASLARTGRAVGGPAPGRPTAERLVLEARLVSPQTGPVPVSPRQGTLGGVSRAA